RPALPLPPRRPHRHLRLRGRARPGPGGQAQGRPPQSLRPGGGEGPPPRPARADLELRAPRGHLVPLHRTLRPNRRGDARRAEARVRRAAAEVRVRLPVDVRAEEVDALVLHVEALAGDGGPGSVRVLAAGGGAHAEAAEDHPVAVVPGGAVRVRLAIHAAELAGLAFADEHQAGAVVLAAGERVVPHVAVQAVHPPGVQRAHPGAGGAELVRLRAQLVVAAEVLALAGDARLPQRAPLVAPAPVHAPVAGADLPERAVVIQRAGRRRDAGAGGDVAERRVGGADRAVPVRGAGQRLAEPQPVAVLRRPARRRRASLVVLAPAGARRLVAAVVQPAAVGAARGVGGADAAVGPHVVAEADGA